MIVGSGRDWERDVHIRVSKIRNSRKRTRGRASRLECLRSGNKGSTCMWRQRRGSCYHYHANVFYHSSAHISHPATPKTTKNRQNGTLQSRQRINNIL